MLFQIRTVALAVAAGAVALAGAAAAQPQQSIEAVDEVAPSGIALHHATDTALPHIVGFADAPLATYRGEVAGLAAPPRRGEGRGRIDVASPQALAYVQTLEARQRGLEVAMQRALGRGLAVRARMQHAFNGVVVDLTAEEAREIAAMPGVVRVEAYREYELDTDVGPLHIGADTVWLDGKGLDQGPVNPRGNKDVHSPGAQGEGIVFGIIDSGANTGSPSFAATDMDGYTHVNPLGEGNYLGTCQPGEVDEGRCNAKLIGGYDFICPLTPHCDNPDLREEPGFRDTSGHGTHVGSTVAGNRRMASFLGNEVEISGVAPRANLVFFNACYVAVDGRGLCPNVSTLASINQAVADGVVHGLSYSISGGGSPWTDANSAAFLAATDAGIYVSASGGNSGPGAGTAGHRQPWVHTIAAAQHGRGAFAYELHLSGDPAISPVILTPGVNGVGQDGDIPGDTPFLVSPGIDTTEDGCADFPAAAFDGAIAMIRRGGCPFSDKVNNAEAAGAIAVVIANNTTGALSPSVPGTQIPAYAATLSDSNAVRDYVAANPGTTAGIPFAAAPQANTPDQLAAFSSRGPIQFDMIKPDATAPGVLVLAADAGPEFDGFEDLVGLKSGTSMAQPHNLGAAGLVRQLNPDWTVPEVKSALMMTAEPSVLLEDGVTPADAFAGGSGSIRVDRAVRAGLVLHETTANFQAANPDAGGDPSSLNVASMANADCGDGCGFTRTFRATSTAKPRDRARGGVSETYDAVLEGLDGSVSHTTFTVSPGQTITLDVDIDTSGLTPGEYAFGQLLLTPANTGLPTLRLPIAVLVRVIVEPPPPPENALVDRFTDAFITHLDGGFGGAYASRLQNSSLGMTTLGTNANIASNFAMADSFSVPAGGWSIDAFRAYAYQTGSGAESTLTGLRMWIMDGPPDDPASTVVFGDATTNVMTSTAFTGIYRDSETAPGGDARPVMEAVAEFASPIELAEGDYWVVFGFTGSTPSGPWAPPRTIVGETVTGAAKQRGSDGVTWSDYRDGGTGTAQGLPFVIQGTVP